ncbi:unnamed protein product [Choristocarpus tenellus]
MHGRKKSDLPQTQEEKDAVKSKIANYQKVIGAVVHKRKVGEIDGELKVLVGKVLRLHPDYYSMWNYRREGILEQLRKLGDGEGMSGEETVGAVYKEELDLTVDCIKRSSKSYPPWHHRKWALERWLELPGGRKLLAGELDLCRQFLDLDGRNFHCWAYRMWVAEQAGLPAAEDFEFTTEKILQNFSNYSAFHFRSKLLSRMITEEGRDCWQLLDEELDLAHQAMFTEPADQSVWWYHHFLLSWAARVEEGCVPEADTATDGEVVNGVTLAKRYSGVLQSEASILRELIEVEGRCKWAELALLLVTQRLVRSLNITGDEKDQVGALDLKDTCRSMAEQLTTLDPMHSRFYEFLDGGGEVWGLETRVPKTVDRSGSAV